MDDEIRIVSFKELEREADEYLAERERRNPTSKAGITLTGGGYDYRIEADRIDTPGKLLHWLAHLADKTWVTAEDLRDVIRFAQRQGIDPYVEAA